VFWISTLVICWCAIWIERWVWFSFWRLLRTRAIVVAASTRWGLRGTGRRRERSVVFWAVHRIQGSAGWLSLSLRGDLAPSRRDRRRCLNALSIEGNGAATRANCCILVAATRIGVPFRRLNYRAAAPYRRRAMPHAFHTSTTRSSLLPRSDRGGRGDDGSVDLSRWRRCPGKLRAIAGVTRARSRFEISTDAREAVLWNIYVWRLSRLYRSGACQLRRTSNRHGRTRDHLGWANAITIQTPRSRPWSTPSDTFRSPRALRLISKAVPPNRDRVEIRDGGDSKPDQCQSPALKITGSASLAGAEKGEKEKD